jgi:hypothetical protein
LDRTVRVGMATGTSPWIFENVKCRLCARRDLRAAVCVLVLLAYGLSSGMSFLDDVFRCREVTGRCFDGDPVLDVLRLVLACWGSDET